MITTVRKWGNSLGIRIPKAIAEDANIEEGMALHIRQGGNQIVLEPVRPQIYKLDDLLGRVSKKNLHTEIDAGAAQGRETW